MDRLTYILSLIVVGLTPLDAVTVADDLSIGRVFYLLLLFSAFFSKSVLKVPQGGYLKILFVFSLWAFLTSYWSFKPDETMYRCLYLVQYFVLAVILQNVIDTPQKFHWLCGAWFLGAMYIATETIFNYLVYGITSASLYRVDEFGNANENSFMLCFGVILFLVNAERIKYKILIYAVLLYSFLAILANGSRTGFIMYLLVIFIYLLSELKRGSKSIYYIFPVFLWLAVYYFNHVLSEGSYERFMHISDDIKSSDLANRQWIWRMALEIMSEKDVSLLWGTGWSTFPYVLQSHTSVFYDSHNFYLNILFTTGIIGFCILGYYLFTLVRYISFIPHHRMQYSLLLIIPMISMLTTNWEYRRWWFLLGVFVYKLYQNSLTYDGEEE